MSTERFSAPLAPWHRSAIWSLGPAYFKVRGLEAWDQGEVPSLATSNVLSGQRFARLVHALDRARGGRPLSILEVGVGSGAFLTHLLDSLEGTDLYHRLTYVATDLSADNLRALAERPGVSRHETRLVWATCDLQAEVPLRPIDAPLPDRIDLVIANYVCCALPARVVAKRGDEFLELEAQAEDRQDSELAEGRGEALGGLFARLDVRFSWREAKLTELVAEPQHRLAIAALLSPWPEATLVYPQAFLDGLSPLLPYLDESALIAIADYGDLRVDSLAGWREVRPQTYGGSLAHAVCFPALGAFASVAGWGCAISRDPLALVHLAVLSPHGPVPAEVVEVAIGDGGASPEDLLDAVHAAATYAPHDPERALRFLRRAQQLDPNDARHPWQMAQLATELGHVDLALAALDRVAELTEPESPYDIAFQEGRAHARVGRYEPAIAAYRSSVARLPTVSALTNLGHVYRAVGQDGLARESFLAALELEPGTERATSALADLDGLETAEPVLEPEAQQAYDDGVDHMSDLLVGVALWLERYLGLFGHRLTDSTEHLDDRFVAIVEAVAALGRQRLEDTTRITSPEGPGHTSRAFRGREAIAEARDNLARHIASRLAVTPDRLPWRRLVETFDLDTTDEDILLAALAPLWSLDFQRLYRFAWADFTEHHTTIGFLEDLLTPDPGPARENLARHLEADGVLVRTGLITLTPRHKGIHSETPTARLELRVTVPDAVVRFLRFGEALPLQTLWEAGGPPVQYLSALGPAVPIATQTSALSALRQELAAARIAHRPLRVILLGAEGTGRTTVARMANTVIRLDGESIADMPAERLAVTLTEAARAARLHEALLVVPIDWTHREGEPREKAERFYSLRRTLARSGADVVLIASDPRATAGLSDLGFVELVVGPPTTAEQRTLWEHLLPHQDTPRRWLWTALGSYSLTPGAIAGAVHELARGRYGADPVRVLEAVRRQLPKEVGRLAERVETAHTRTDLILPPDALEQLSFLVSCARHKSLVYDQWNFRGRMSSGRALSALFHGPPGTGKTMAASVVAGELGRELLRVDLSRVVDKYIGETEKNLGALFDHAETSQSVLLFDEADSLFAKRTEVKSSNDRYANLEVNYLLQRIERYEGICILTTNFIDSLDDALQRRIAVKVRFPMPEAEERARLWRGFLPAEAPLAPHIDWSLLGERFELAGGHIKNAVMRAAFGAAETQRPIDLDKLWAGAVMVSRELGKLITADMAEPPY